MRKLIDIVTEAQQVEEAKINSILAAGSLALATAVGVNAVRDDTVNQSLDSSREFVVDDGDTPQAHSSKWDKQAYLLALTMWGEARNQGVEGMRAVGHVIMNRLFSERHFGKTLAHVVWKRKAFSCWDDINRDKMREITHMDHDSAEYKTFIKAYRLAKKIIARTDRDPTRGALFYHTDSIMPTWAKGVSPLAHLGQHIFYNRDRKAD